MTRLTGDALPNYRRKPRILFVGEDNATHTQMAEAYLRATVGDLIDVQSAGIRSMPIDQRALGVIAEEGTDIAHLQSKLISAELLIWTDIVVTMAGREDDVRVAIPRSAHLKHWPIDPPPKDGDAGLDDFRQIRDEVRRRTLPLINSLRLFNLDRPK